MKAHMSIIRLVPDGIKEENINIGIILKSEETGELRLSTDLNKIYIVKNYLYPDLDMELIKAILKDINIKFFNFLNYNKIKDIPNLYNGIIRFTEFKGLITNDLSKELDLLMKQYVTNEYWIKI